MDKTENFYYRVSPAMLDKIRAKESNNLNYMSEIDLKIKCLEIASQSEIIGDNKLETAKEFFDWVKESIPKQPKSSS